MNKVKSTGLWSKYFIIICFISLIGNSVVFMLDNTLSIYANDVWSSKSAAGLLTTTFTVGSVTAAALCGSLVDRSGRQRMLIIGCLFFAIGTGAMMLSTEVWLAMTCRVIQGVGKGVFGVASMSIAADIIPSAHRGKGTSYYGLGSTLAQAIGPTVGIALISGGHYNRLFGVNTAMYIAAILIALLLNYERKGDYAAALEKREKPAEVAAPTRVYHGVWKIFERTAIPCSVAAFIYGIGCTGILIFLTLYATDVLGIANPGGYFTAAAVTMLICSLFVGRIVDRFGIRGAVVFGFLCAALSNILVIDCANYFIFIISGITYGLSMSFIYSPLCAAIIIDSPADRKGVANSTLGFLLDGGILIASAVTGIVADKFGYTVTFIATTVANVVGIVFTVIFLSNSSRARLRKRNGVE